MKKRLFLIISLLALCVSGCGNSGETSDDKTGSSKESSIFESNREIDAFADIKVVFEGFSGQGIVKIDTSNCAKEVKENIEFEYNSSLDGTLENGQSVTISAVSKNKKYTIVEEQQIYTVNGLFAFVEGTHPSEFSDGMLSFRYENPSDNKTYIAYMDTSGNVKFQIDTNIIDDYNFYTSFKNGKAMIKFNDGKNVAFVDKSGTIVKTIDITKNFIAEEKGMQDAESSIIFMEEGYCVVKTEIKDFSNNYYIYTFYNSEGKCVFIDKSDIEYWMGTYRGSNVILLSGDIGDTGWYFLDGNSEVNNLATYNNMSVEFFDELYDIYKVDTWGDANTITILNNQCYSWKLDVEGIDLSDYTVSGIYHRGNVMMMHEDTNEVGYYNFDTEKFVSTTQYAEQIKGMPKFCGDVITANMRGADGESYIGIFDMDWKLITDPIKGSVVLPFDKGVFICYGTEVMGQCINESDCRYYDYSGNLLFTSNGQLDFSEGLAYNENYQWLNTNNEIAIERMDFSDVKTLQISEVESKEETHSIEGSYVGKGAIEFGDTFEIDNNGNITYTVKKANHKENLTYTKIGDAVWKTSPVSWDANCELIFYMDNSGNLFVDSTSDEAWEDEYFVRQ